MIFSVLSHPYRREAVTIVAEIRGTITHRELAQEIATRLDPSRFSDGDVDPAETIRVELYHNHLPKLAKAGLIKFDSGSNLVSSTLVTTYLTGLIQIGFSIAEKMEN